MSIKRDLAIVATAEVTVMKILEEFGFACGKNTEKGKFSYFDILAIINKEEVTLEVKFDIYANKSGNIAIETFNPKTGKPSGLGITKADLWVHITDQPYVTTVKRLKKFVEDTPPFRTIACGGDDNATLLLFKADIILDEIFVPLSDKETWLKMLEE